MSSRVRHFTEIRKLISLMTVNRVVSGQEYVRNLLVQIAIDLINAL